MADAQDHLRAADADREAAAERLRTALNEGRLTLDEYDDRLHQAYAARTYGDLDRLFADLPGAGLAVAPGGAPARAAEPGPPAVRRPRGNVSGWLVWVWCTWALAVGINVVIWAVVSLSSQEWVYFWPIWVAGPWGAVLLFSTIGGLARGEPDRWAEKSERKRRRQREA